MPFGLLAQLLKAYYRIVSSEVSVSHGAVLAEYLNEKYVDT